MRSNPAEMLSSSECWHEICTVASEVTRVGVAEPLRWNRAGYWLEVFHNAEDAKTVQAQQSVFAFQYTRAKSQTAESHQATVSTKKVLAPNVIT